MTSNDTHLLLRAFVDELARCGMRAACTSPGSRSAPLLLALTRDDRIRCWSHIDERCAAFFALGLAKASGQPVALACTSGTAAAEYTPAVHEAHEARVPLLVLTADRPPELRGVGAGQTIDQLGLYGSAAKWFVEVDTAVADAARMRWIRSLACRAYWAASSGRPGPIHLNFPLREPLVGDEPLPSAHGGRADGRPWLCRPPRQTTLATNELEALAELLRRSPRGVVVAGRSDCGIPAAAAFAQAAGYPLLADPLSGVRHGPAAIAHYDALLRDTRFANEQRPELVIRVGDLPTSKPLRGWLAGLDDVRQLAVEPDGAWQDPDGVLSDALAADADLLLCELTARLGPPVSDGDWLERWRQADAAAAAAIAATLGEELSEPAVAARLGARLPAKATLFVASSMPVRDVETFWPLRADSPRLLSNRGANGIDGTVSAAFGAAAAAEGPVVLLIGDVALAHDVGGLLAGTRLGLDLTIVAINNDGGGIFHFLPIAEQRDAFEQHVATPHGLDLSRIAAAYGARHHRVADTATFDELLARELVNPGSAIIIEVPGDREANVALHRRVWAAVSAALQD